MKKKEYAAPKTAPKYVEFESCLLDSSGPGVESDLVDQGEAQGKSTIWEYMDND